MSVDQKHLAEARSGILSILHTIMSSVTLLWSVLHQADSSDKPAAASAASTSNINLGSTKVHQAQICAPYDYFREIFNYRGYCASLT